MIIMFLVKLNTWLFRYIIKGLITADNKLITSVDFLLWATHVNHCNLQSLAIYADVLQLKLLTHFYSLYNSV